MMYMSKRVLRMLCETMVAVNSAAFCEAYAQQRASLAKTFQESAMLAHGMRDRRVYAIPQREITTIPTRLARYAHVPLSKMRRNWNNWLSLMKVAAKLRLTFKM